jgi:hypothetical protein
MKERQMFRATTHITGLIILSMLFSASPAKPSASSNQCPTITIECISDNDCCNSPFEFVVHINGKRPTDKPVYKWSISAGEIVSGQGTASIKVDAAKYPGQVVTATVEIDGLEPGCAKTASVTQTICDSPASRLFDQYGNISFTKEKSRLDMFANQLKEMPGAQGYLIAYNDSRKRAERAKQYLVDKHNVEAERIVVVEGGKREDLTIELYIVPAGANPPSANLPMPSNNSFNRSGIGWLFIRKD